MALIRGPRPGEKTYVVTGASRGIGLALVRAIVARGDRAIAAVRERSTMIDGALTLVLDVTSTESVREARGDFDEPIDVLINNAGMTGGPQYAPGMNLARAELIVDTNALGPLRVYDAFADLLRIRRGKLVNVSSEAGSLGQFRASSKPEYAMSKAALNSLTRWIGAKDSEVLPVAIDPGWTRTETGGDAGPQSPDEAAQRMLAAIDRVDESHRGGFFDTSLAPIPW